jgi:hypothetical protein
MKSLRRFVVLAVLTLLLIQSAPLFDSKVLAGPVPAAASQAKKKRKIKKRKEKILKGRHGKHHGKPA